MLLAGGGTGGHVSPLLAVAEALAEASVAAPPLFVGGRRGLEDGLVRSAGIAFHATPMPSLRDPDSRLSLVARGILFPIAFADALVTVLRYRPDVCCTTGGLVAFPVVLAARVARVPVFIWEGNVVPGRVNRALAGRAQRVGVTFAGSLARFSRGKAVLTGNPVRRSLLRWSKTEGRAALGLPATGAVVLVTGGSQGAAPVNEAVFAALPRLVRRATIVHHVGAAHLRRAESLREGLPEADRGRYRPYGYLHEEMGAALAAADLVVARASSSSIAEPLAFGTPLVLIPFGAAADAHQTANARAIEEVGAAVAIRESELDGDRLAAVVSGLLDDPARLARMTAAARAAGRPDAAREIARLVLDLAGCV